MIRKQKIFFFSLVILALIMSGDYVLGLKVSPPEKIVFSPNLTSEERLVYPRSIFLSEDGLITIIDQQNRSLSSFQQKGKMLIPANSPQKGSGINGVITLIGPAYSTYSQAKKLAISDLKLGRIFYLLRSTENWSAFNYKKEFPCPRGCTALFQAGEKIFVAGSVKISDQNYELYAIDIDSSKLTPLLTGPQKYGFRNLTPKIKEQIYAIGITGYVTGSNDGSNLVYAWEGGHITILSFGNNEPKFLDVKKTKNYYKPIATSTLIANRVKYYLEARKERLETMSFVRGVFATSKFFYILYEGPAKGKASAAWIQQYDFSGKFLGEVPVPNLPKGGLKMFWFDKETGYLYSLSVEEPNPLDFFILKYKILE